MEEQSWRKADPWLVDLANVPWEDVVCTVWGCNTLSLSPWPSRKRGMAAPNLAHDPNKKSEWVGSLISEKDKRIIAASWCDRWEWWELSQSQSKRGEFLFAGRAERLAILHAKDFRVEGHCIAKSLWHQCVCHQPSWTSLGGGMVVHGDPVFDCLKGAKTQHFSFTHGLPASTQAVLHEVYPLGNSFVKAVKSEFALAKVCQAIGHWLDQVLVHLKFWMVSNCEQFCLVPKSWKLCRLCPVKNCFCWKFHKFKWLDHPTSTISKTQLQLWNRKSPILLVSQDVNPCTWMSKD